MKTHLSLTTTDLTKSIAFYSVLLDAKPAKALDDYVLFITEQPALELALHPSRAVSPPGEAHYGINVASSGDVERAISRLESAGLVSSIEREETCCYANQTKVWAADPDGRRWEVYTVHEDTEYRDEPGASCCADTDAACCAA